MDAIPYYIGLRAFESENPLFMTRAASGSFWGRLTEKTEYFWGTNLYFAMMLAVTAVSMVTGNVVPSTVALAVLCAWTLLFCRDILAAALPFLLIFLLSTLQYKDLTVFLPCAPLAALIIGGLIVHLIRWKKPLVAGRSVRGLVAVSIATILGGVGFIPAAQYFSPLSIYYALGLGAGLLAAYLLLRSELEMPRSYDLLYRLMQMLYTLGLAMVLAVGCYYLHHWAEFAKCWELPGIPYRNFAATILVSTLPAVFYMAGRDRRHLATVFLWCAAMFFSGSRSALLFGAVMVLLGFIYLVKRGYLSLWVFLAIVVAVTAAMALFGSQVYEMFFGARGDPDHFISPTEERWLLLDRGFADFFNHPLLGIGLGNQKNTDLFAGVPGSMVFYHNAILQVMGSMGIVGVAAYALLLADRLRLLLHDREVCYMAGLYYLGMLMVSMTNPGLFCPLPNAALTVLVFTVVEKYVDGPATALSKRKL